MKTRALLATLGAMGGMLLYIAFRFKWLSGVAAILATMHDVILTLGLFAFAGREINLSIVAALLTLIGYSTNDTIVVFDRVRENLRFRAAVFVAADEVQLLRRKPGMFFRFAEEPPPEPHP